MFKSAVLLDTGMSAKEVAEHLDSYGANSVVVLRRPVGVRLLWYLLDRSEVGAWITAAPAETKLGSLLKFEHLEPSPTLPVETLRQTKVLTPTVLLDGAKFAGVKWEDPPEAAAPKPAPSTAPAPSPEPALPRQHAAPQPAISPGKVKSPHWSASSPPPGLVSPAQPRLEELARPLVTPEEPDSTSAKQPQGWWQAVREAWRQRPSGGAHPAPFRPVGQVVQLGAKQQATQSQTHALVATLQAPQIVSAQQSFNLSLDIAFTPGKLSLISGLKGSTVPVEARVVGAGVTAPEGWRREIAFSKSLSQKNQVTWPLVARDPSDGIDLSHLLVLLSSQGRFAGMLCHPFAIAPAGPPPGDLLPAAGQSWLQAPALAKLELDDQEPPVDLIVYITSAAGNDASGEFNVTFHSPHPFTNPAEAVSFHLPKNADAFALDAIKRINQVQHHALVANQLKAEGRAIASQLPEQFWTVLGQVQQHVQKTWARPVTLLLASTEHHIPWELAYLETPFDPRRPAFLGAQVVMGRWLLSQRTNPPWPIHQLEVKDMAVFVGDYAAENGQRPLPHALNEGAALEQKYQARRWSVNLDHVKLLLDGKLGVAGAPGVVQAIHFACHGEAEPTVIYLQEGEALHPLIFESLDWTRKTHPFLFLNACQVGHNGDLLGECGGFAGSSLRAGFAGFLAPLWSVKDDVAESLALQFYEKMLGADPANPPTVGEVLRELRSLYRPDDALPQATYLAYLFWGHPLLRFVKPTAKAVSIQRAPAEELARKTLFGGS